MTPTPTRQELETFLNCPEAQDDLLSVRMARELLRLMDLWQPIETIPKGEHPHDGVTVFLKNAKGEIDIGKWYWFTNDDDRGDISSKYGYGDYTHWLPHPPAPIQQPTESTEP